MFCILIYVLTPNSQLKYIAVRDINAYIRFMITDMNNVWRYK